MARPETKSPEQLRGGAIAIGAFGTTTDFAARFALRKFALVPGKDVTLPPIGNNPIRLGALESGRVVATSLNPPASVMAQKKGLNTLLASLRLAFNGRTPERSRPVSLSEEYRHGEALCQVLR